MSADRITELDWWEQGSFFEGEVSVTATPAQHFSGRSPTTRNHTLWSSFVVDGGGHRVYFGGDSGLMTGFAEIGEHFRPFDLILLEIGAYHPAWANVHLGPINALSALAALGGGPLLPIHWGTFDLATHRWDQPIEALTNRAADDDVQVLTPRLGEPAEPALAAGRGQLWWKDVARIQRPDPALAPDQTVAPPPPTD